MDCSRETHVKMLIFYFLGHFWRKIWRGDHGLRPSNPTKKKATGWTFWVSWYFEIVSFKIRPVERMD